MINVEVVPNSVVAAGDGDGAGATKFGVPEICAKDVLSIGTETLLLNVVSMNAGFVSSDVLVIGVG